MIYSVYKIECLVNNKVYIGQTNNYKKRISLHKKQLKDNNHYNKYLQEDYNMYGFNNFRYIELSQCDTRQQSYDMEDYWINYYGGIESSNTYNMQNNVTKNKEYGRRISKSHKGKQPWNKGRKMTPEEIKVNSLSHMGIKRSPESIEKQKRTIANNPNFGNKGKHLSEETKHKISIANKGKPAYNKGKRNKTHKYDDIVGILKDEYKHLKSYAAVQRLHPEICYDIIRSLIMFGTTNKKPIE